LVALWLRNRNHYRRVGPDLADEPVATFGKRLDIAGIVCRFTQSFANLVHRSGQTVFEVNERIRGP